jgi:hypothetical protein
VHEPPTHGVLPMTGKGPRARPAGREPRWFRS